mmetsp:Transcript_9741/g.24495  ORF Transcript_9741/g.24495 Transcript_9741/m.24495 type:complete len:201 (+) Transcript_9741:306-908(+)
MRGPSSTRSISRGHFKSCGRGPRDFSTTSARTRQSTACTVSPRTYWRARTPTGAPNNTRTTSTSILRCSTRGRCSASTSAATAWPTSCISACASTSFSATTSASSTPATKPFSTSYRTPPQTPRPRNNNHPPSFKPRTPANASSTSTTTTSPPAPPPPRASTSTASSTSTVSSTSTPLTTSTASPPSPPGLHAVRTSPPA